MVTYVVSCEHAGCDFVADVDLVADPGDWEPETAQLVEGEDGQIESVLVVRWGGAPLEDAYQAHYAMVHEPEGEPPKLRYLRR